jgi:DNA repair protein RecN (Recombination protein N)
MLQRISFKNFILIPDISIALNKGFCAITGESGSGKTMILEGIKFCLGLTKNKNYSKIGCDETVVILEFQIHDNLELIKLLEEASITYDYNLIIRKHSYNEQKSRSFINDIPVNSVLLKKVASTLVEIHSQNDKGLDDNELRITSLLDNFGKISGAQELETQYQKFHEIDIQINKLKETAHKTSMEKAFYSFAVDEINALNLKPGEEAELEISKKTLNNSLTIKDSLWSIKSSLNGQDGALGNIWTAYNRSLKLFELTEKKVFKELASIFERSAIDLEDSVGSIDKELSSIGPQQNIDEIEDRLYLIKNTARKYSVPSDELAKILENYKNKLSIAENFEDMIDALNVNRKELWNHYLENALKISTERKKIAKQFCHLINEELNSLKMEGAKIEFNFQRLSDQEVSKTGIDKITIQIKTSQNQPMLNIADIASGGEKSRILLVVKSLTNLKSKKILIFDEIDSGIGGATASAVGRKIKALSSNQQILLITHNAQVAALSDQLLKVYKINNQQESIISIDTLTNEQRKNEIARMISGEFVTSEALAQAEKLINN